ncbi:hypothetical protein ASD88_20645 [Pelomonas sp. Root662]|nr:hypothetical protein ASC81_19995 [Pelomonas sp. Root405]KRA69613.1 hypothetical protein ASD88_20645 [Pelomonas sp. Root662]
MASLVAQAAPPTASTHRWFPYRPIDAPLANAAQLTAVQVIENGDFILSFSSDVDPICTTGTAGNGSIQKNRLYFRAGYEDLSAAAVKSLLATALLGLQGGTQILVMYNFTTGTCDGRYLTAVKK